MVSQAEYEPYIPEPLIKKVAGDLIGWYRLTASDRDEIEQFLRMRIVQAWPRFNPKRSKPQTYADRIVKSSIPSFIRDRTRLKRNPARIQGTLESCKYEPTTDRHHLERIDLEVDTHIQLGVLSPSDRRFACLIMEFGLEAATRLASLRPSEVKSALGRMRQMWEECAMDAYLPSEMEIN